MPPKGGAGEISATVDQSNEMRAALGIKPLRTEADTGKKGSSNEPVHAPADAKSGPSEADIKKQKAAEKSRKEHEELVKGKGLGDILADEEGAGGAGDWVNRTRNKDGSMKAASQLAAAEAAKKRKKDLPDTTEVPKLKVRHDATDINEGETVTMVLNDKPILDKDGNINDAEPDELANVLMMDKERAKHNDEVRKQVEYDPTKQGQDILSKYDDLKTGPTGFIIGGQVMGVIDERDPEKRLAILTALSEKQSLEQKMNFQSDYYTSEEMAAKFNSAPKKKTKKRKASDTQNKEDQVGDPGKMHVGGKPTDAGSDEEDPELYEQLSKQRRLVKKADAGATKKGEAALAAVSERISALATNNEDKGKEEEDKSAKKDDGVIALTATTEFCNVVQTPLEKMETLKHESFRGSTLYKQQASQRKGVAAGEKKAKKAGTGASGSKDFDDEAAASSSKVDETLEELLEDDLDLSCSSGLEYLRARSQIGNDQDSHKNRKSDNRPLEMSTVDGDIKLEYRDDFGRVQTPKEAFRAISWKFHGKMPGRKNMERRLLRLENEMRLKSMNPMEALPTLRALRHVQHTDAKPYMVLSGANEK